MDGQNLNNESNNMYQDNTAATPVTPVVEEAPAKKADALAIVSLIAGILSIVLCCGMYWAFVPGAVGIVCSILSKKNNGKTGVATAGLICSIIGIVLGLIWLIAGVGILALVGMSEAAYY